MCPNNQEPNGEEIPVKGTEEKFTTYSEYMREHIEACKRTGSVTDNMLASTFDNPQSNTGLTMSIIGVYTELAELADIIQKKVYYGIEMDVPSLLEEAGDTLYYWDLLIDRLRTLTCCEAFNDITLRDLNRKKLAIRYPNGYSNACAINKDKKAERAVFENADLY